MSKATKAASNKGLFEASTEALDTDTPGTPCAVPSRVIKSFPERQTHVKTSIRVSNCPHKNIRGYIEGVSRRGIVERAQEGHSMTSICADMPEPGAPAGETASPAVAATDDDGGDGDGEPARGGGNGKASILAGMKAQEKVSSKGDFKSNVEFLEVLQRIAAALEKQNLLIEAQTQTAEENTQSVRQAIDGVSNRLEDMGRFS